MHPAALPIETLLAACTVRRSKRSGPGGQHRNKVETAVVVEHTASGVRGEASERRSQEQNRQMAVQRLRVNLAVEVRRPLECEGDTPSPLWQSRLRGGRLNVSTEHADFPALLAEALDVAAACDMDVKSAAERLGASATQLVKLLRSEPRALELVNRRRRELALRTLR
jgi:hypothetical protein